MPLTLGSLQCKPPPNLDNPLTPTKRDFRMEFQQIRFNNILELPEEVVEEYALPNIRLHFIRDCVVATFIEPVA